VRDVPYSALITRALSHSMKIFLMPSFAALCNPSRKAHASATRIDESP